MKQIDLTLVLPCYNEAEHLTESIEQIVDVLKKTDLRWEVIFIEDKSQDQTARLLKSFLRKHKDRNFRVIWHTQNEGRGKSVTDGIEGAEGEYAGFIDIDCEASPIYIPECISVLESGFDVVCGKRIYQTDLSGMMRAAASKLYASLVKVVLHSKCQDTEAGYKFFRRTKILPVLKLVQDTGWFWDTEVMLRSEIAGLSIYSMPILFVRRKDKTSTVHLVKDTIAYLSKLWRFRCQLQTLRS